MLARAPALSAELRFHFQRFTGAPSRALIPLARARLAGVRSLRHSLK